MLHYVSISGHRPVTRLGGIAGKGLKSMKVLSFLQGRLARKPSAAQADNQAADDAQRVPADQDLPPFDGYDGLDQREVRERLSDQSQIELEAIESYERFHENREPVLTKVRYMRGREPLPGYDALGVEEILAALEEADLATIKKVRAYERKFAKRPAVLEEVLVAQHRLQAGEPKSAAPGYQPLGGALASSAPVDVPETSARS